ncbi:MAG: outer membrane protein assembly factor BamE [Rickettsiaceae bacterium]|nr:outer membrane protein assembly factor BamE [Rickettsiaceae bacterium]
MKNIHLKAMQVVLIGALSFFVQSCQHNITQGTMIPEDKILSLSKKRPTKQEIEQEIGTPEIIVTLNENSWYYVYREMTKRAFFDPVIRDQEVVRLDFEKDKLRSIEKLSDVQYSKISIIQENTKAKIKSKGAIREYLGNVGKFYKYKKTENRRG